MCIRAIIAAAAAAALTPVSASATDISSPATLWVRGYPVTANGNPVGCAIEYSVGGKDYVSKNGGVITLTGSLVLYRGREGQGPAYAVLKVILDDFSGEGRQATRPFAIHMVSQNGKVVKGRAGGLKLSDTPGAVLQAFDLDDGFMSVFTDVIQQQKLIIGFNRREGGVDLRVPLDLTVRSTDLRADTTDRSNEMVVAFTRCASEILKD